MDRNLQVLRVPTVFLCKRSFKLHVHIYTCDAHLSWCEKDIHRCILIRKKGGNKRAKKLWGALIIGCWFQLCPVLLSSGGEHR